MENITLIQLVEIIGAIFCDCRCYPEYICEESLYNCDGLPYSRAAFVETYGEASVQLAENMAKEKYGHPSRVMLEKLDAPDYLINRLTEK